MTLDDNLRMIEEALEIGKHATLEPVFDKALASLRALFEGDAGEDEKEISDFLRIYREMKQKNWTPEDTQWFDNIEAALSRLSLKAKALDLMSKDFAEVEKRHGAALVEAKREVLEEVGDIPRLFSGHEKTAKSNYTQCYDDCPFCAYLKLYAPLDKAAGK